MRLLAEMIVGSLLIVGIAHATPWPSTHAQLDLDANCVVNFNDALEHVKYALGVKPIPDRFDTCADWYPTYTPTPVETETPTPGPVI